MKYKIAPLILSICVTLTGMAQTEANFQAFNSTDTNNALGIVANNVSIGQLPKQEELGARLVIAEPDARANEVEKIAQDVAAEALSVRTPYYPMGMMHCAAGPTPIQDVMNPVTGQTWMDRNLGAQRDAADSYDPYAFGDLYQWGRFADGHQCRNSSISKKTAVSTSPNPEEDGFGRFILPQKVSFDWLQSENTSLWQGVGGANNPCPFGYRVPTEAELAAEMTSWATADASGAIASPLKWPLAGYRYNKDGDIYDAGALGSYWSSTIDGTSTRYLFFDESHADISTYFRANGHSVRCIKE